MKTAAVAPHFVQEAKAQHQYARVRIPARLQVKLDGRTQEFPVADLSAAGFNVNAGSEALRLRQVYNGHLVLELEGHDIAVDVNFVPRSFDSVNHRCGCEFQNLGHREFSALRHLITASLSGEAVSASEVLNALARDDVSKVHKDKGINDQDVCGLPRAMVGSLMVMLVCLFAISFVTSALSDIYLVTKAESEAGATDDAPVWLKGNGLGGEGEYSVGQVDVSGPSVVTTEPLPIEPGVGPMDLTGGHWWAPNLQEFVASETR